MFQCPRGEFGRSLLQPRKSTIVVKQLVRQPGALAVKPLRLDPTVRCLDNFAVGLLASAPEVPCVQRAPLAGGDELVQRDDRHGELA